MQLGKKLIVSENYSDFEWFIDNLTRESHQSLIIKGGRSYNTPLFYEKPFIFGSTHGGQRT